MKLNQKRKFTWLDGIDPTLTKIEPREIRRKATTSVIPSASTSHSSSIMVPKLSSSESPNFEEGAGRNMGMLLDDGKSSLLYSDDKPSRNSSTVIGDMQQQHIFQIQNPSGGFLPRIQKLKRTDEKPIVEVTSATLTQQSSYNSGGRLISDGSSQQQQYSNRYIESSGHSNNNINNRGNLLNHPTVNAGDKQLRQMQPSFASSSSIGIGLNGGEVTGNINNGLYMSSSSASAARREYSSVGGSISEEEQQRIKNLRDQQKQELNKLKQIGDDEDDLDLMNVEKIFSGQQLRSSFVSTSSSPSYSSLIMGTSAENHSSSSFDRTTSNGNNNSSSSSRSNDDDDGNKMDFFNNNGPPGVTSEMTSSSSLFKAAEPSNNGHNDNGAKATTTTTNIINNKEGKVEKHQHHHHHHRHIHSDSKDKNIKEKKQRNEGDQEYIDMFSATDMNPLDQNIVRIQKMVEVAFRENSQEKLLHLAPKLASKIAESEKHDANNARLEASVKKFVAKYITHEQTRN